jgi:hypothetical protein
MCVTTVATVMMLTDTGPYGIHLYKCMYYNRCHGNDVKGFWALWDNIYKRMCVTTVAKAMMLRDIGHYGILMTVFCYVRLSHLS